MHTQFEWQDEGIPESKRGYSHWDWDELFDKLAQRPNTWAMVYSEKPRETLHGSEPFESRCRLSKALLHHGDSRTSTPHPESWMASSKCSPYGERDAQPATVGTREHIASDASA